MLKAQRIHQSHDTSFEDSLHFIMFWSYLKKNWNNIRLNLNNHCKPEWNIKFPFSVFLNEKRKSNFYFIILFRMGLYAINMGEGGSSLAWAQAWVKARKFVRIELTFIFTYMRKNHKPFAGISNSKNCVHIICYTFLMNIKSYLQTFGHFFKIVRNTQIWVGRKVLF